MGPELPRPTLTGPGEILPLGGGKTVRMTPAVALTLTVEGAAGPVARPAHASNLRSRT
jgi:hypothetical protein